MIDCGNCGHPRRCVTMDKCIMGKMRPAHEPPVREKMPKNVNTSRGNVLMQGDSPVADVPKKSAKKKTYKKKAN